MSVYFAINAVFVIEKKENFLKLFFLLIVLKKKRKTTRNGS